MCSQSCLVCVLMGLVGMSIDNKTWTIQTRQDLHSLRPWILASQTMVCTHH